MQSTTPAISSRHFQRLFLTCFLLIPGLVLLWNGGLAWLVESQGALAHGEILSSSTSTRGGTATTPSQTNYSVAYRFKTADGTVVVGTSTMTDRLWQSADGKTLVIRYLPWIPQRNAPAGTTSLWAQGIAGLLGLLLTLPMLVVLTRVAARIRLEKNGTPACGTVTEVSDSDSGYLEVRYEYRDTMDRCHSGTFRERHPRHAPGDTGEVRFDPGAAEKSVWMESNNFYKPVAAARPARTSSTTHHWLGSSKNLKRTYFTIVNVLTVLAVGAGLIAFFDAFGVDTAQMAETSLSSVAQFVVIVGFLIVVASLIVWPSIAAATALFGAFGLVIYALIHHVLSDER